MIEVSYRNIQFCVHYVIENTTDGSGYVTYDGTDYYHGDSFFGQNANDTYTVSTVNIKVYEDDTELTYKSSINSDTSVEIDPFPETLQVITLNTCENFNDNEEVVYPENVVIKGMFTAEQVLSTKSQIIRKK